MSAETFRAIQIDGTSGNNTTRYDYLCSPDELHPWVDRLIDVDAEVKERLLFSTTIGAPKPRRTPRC